MRRLTAEPLTSEAFQAFGQVFEAPEHFGRIYFSEALASGRAGARPSLSIARVKPVEAPLLIATKMERHEFSSQSFMPLDAGRYLVLVAPMSRAARPDESGLRAFIAQGHQCMTYGMNVWHHPLTVLDRPSKFAIQMWLDGSKSDEEFVDLENPVEIAFAG